MRPVYLKRDVRIVYGVQKDRWFIQRNISRDQHVPYWHTFRSKKTIEKMVGFVVQTFGDDPEVVGNISQMATDNETI